ncbi:hypothetical protein KAT92_05440 [Candidatus Babeliales bacterium]|nr:hypothetical protein [Candidatus Babeliales bacterium]
MTNYWIHGATYYMSSELKKLGAYQPSGVLKKFWRIDSLKRSHSTYKILKELGLKLTKVKDDRNEKH